MVDCYNYSVFVDCGGGACWTLVGPVGRALKKTHARASTVIELVPGSAF